MARLDRAIQPPHVLRRMRLMIAWMARSPLSRGQALRAMTPWVRPMKSAVIVFPASNRDRDAAEVLEKVTGTKPHMVWHGDTQVPDVDLIVLPGGFSYGDYLRCGAMAAQSRIMRDVIAKAGKGVAVLGICNGFQVVTE